MKMLASEFVQKRVISRDGRELGEVTDLEIDPTTMLVSRMAVRLRRDVLSELELRRPLVGTRTVWMPATLVEAVTDAVVLRVALVSLAFDDADWHEPKETGGDTREDRAP